MGANLRGAVGICGLLACLGGVSSTSHAHAQDALAGSYRSSATTVTADVSVWGADCGERPKSQTIAASGNVLVKVSAGELELAFPGWTLRTHHCWSENPAVKRTGHNASSTLWTTTCATPDSDSKRETNRYQVTQTSPTTLELSAQSDYVWQLNTSACTATVRTKQSLERIGGAPASAVEADNTQAVAPCELGKISRIRLRPAEAALTPGQRVCFTARAFDAAGCSKDLAAGDVSFSLEKPQPLRATLSGGCFRAADSAAEAEGVYRVAASHAGKRDQATVTVAIADLSDITARRAYAKADLESEDGAQGGLLGAGVRALGIEAKSPVAWLLGAAGLALLSGLGGAWIVGRRSRKMNLYASPAPTPVRRAREVVSVTPQAQTPSHADAEHSPTSNPARALGGERSGVSEPSPAAAALICPKCRRGYGSSTSRCEADGTELLSYQAFVQQSKASDTKACVKCGQNMASEAAFCGRCGTRT